MNDISEYFRNLIRSINVELLGYTYSDMVSITFIAFNYIDVNTILGCLGSGWEFDCLKYERSTKKYNYEFVIHNFKLKSNIRKYNLNRLITNEH